MSGPYFKGDPYAKPNDGWAKPRGQVMVSEGKRPSRTAPPPKKAPAAAKGLPRPVIIDSETDAIDDRPHYPPSPISVSIRWPGKKSSYHAWGHATANNSTKAQCKRELVEAYKHSDGVCFQNAKFDVDVFETHLGLKPPPPEKVHDTLYLLFLKDPDAGTLELKPAVQRLLGREPDERNAICEWLLQHQPVRGVKISSSRQSDHYFMNYLKHAPGNVVGLYANADVDGAGDLFPVLYKEIRDRGMLGAYDRERRLMPYMLAAERRGLRVDSKRLYADLEAYEGLLQRLDQWLRKKLRIDESVNLDSNKQLLPVLLSGGWVEEGLLVQTAKSGQNGRAIQYSTAKDSLAPAMQDKQLAAIFQYRAQLGTCLKTYMRNWAIMCERSGDRIYTTWNQTRNAEGSGVKGTRTGRMSATWFMNMPKEFKPIFAHDTEGGIDPSDPAKKRKLPKAPLEVQVFIDGRQTKGELLPPLPLCRGYVLPEKGHVIVDRDYSQQEPRILAHFENGVLMHQYQADPWLDVHDNAKAHIERIYQRVFDRRKIKIINLGLIYGEGVAAMAEKMGETYEACKQLKEAVLRLYPGLKDLNDAMKQLSRDNEPLVTWGGREYFCEPPLLHQGRIIKFEYKMVNRLVQGSAADCTKEALIRWHEATAGTDDIFMLQVHDQMAASTPKRDMKRGMERVRQAMESVKFDVPMLTEGDVGLTWGTLQTYDKKGTVVWRGSL